MAIWTEGERKSSKGLKLHTVTALPEDRPKAVLCWHHGLQEHVGRYKQMFTTLADSGIVCYSYDAFGHGRSEGDRALIMRFEDIIDDFAAAAQAAHDDVASRYPAEASSLPFFLGGHSLGGLIAASLAVRDQSGWAGLLVCSPAMGVEFTPMLRVQAALGSLMASIIPRARIVPAVRPEDMNTDPQCVKEYLEDPLNTIGNLAARTGYETLQAMERLQKRWPELSLPLYAHHGDTDRCTSLASTRAFVDASPSKDKTFYTIEGGYHEILFGPGSEAVVTRMADWILQRSGSSGTARM